MRVRGGACGSSFWQIALNAMIDREPQISTIPCSHGRDPGKKCSGIAKMPMNRNDGCWKQRKFWKRNGAWAAFDMQLKYHLPSQQGKGEVWQQQHEEEPDAG